LPSGAIKRLLSAGERFRRGQSMSVRPAEGRVDAGTADAALALLGPDGDTARALDLEADREMSRVVSLSALTTGLAEEYLERLARPIPSLTPAAGVQVVTRGYAARMAVEREPSRFGAPAELPDLSSLPAPRNGRPPQDLLTRAVKSTRRRFPALRAVAEPVWDGFVVLLTARVHRLVPDDGAGGDGPGLLAAEVVDGLARFGWVLRLVDVRYGQEPEHRGA
jgi:hypothetical protein